MKVIASIFLAMYLMFPMIVIAGSVDHQRAEDNEVAIQYIGVEIPLNKILLIRKENRYCALKFINVWIEIDEERLKLSADDIKKGGVTAAVAKESAEKKYAHYMSYYSKDGAPDFFDCNIQQKEGTASQLPLRGTLRPFVYQPGNGCVECGQFKLLWSYKTGVTFIPLGKGSSMMDYGIELAPTLWTDIKDVNVKDARLKWYRYDEKRERIFIPIDNLWKDGN
jgi:hypothetical protein